MGDMMTELWIDELECLTIKGKEMNNEFVNYDASDISLEAYICHLQIQNIQDF